MLAAAKYIGAGIACSGLIVAGIGTIIGSLILAITRYPQLLEVNYSITYLTSIKLVIIIVLIGIHFYLLYIEYIQNKNNNNNKIQYRAAGVLGNTLSANIKGIGTLLVGSATIYHGYSQYKIDMEIKSEAIKNLEKTSLEIENVKTMLYQIREEWINNNISLSSNILNKFKQISETNDTLIKDLGLTDRISQSQQPIQKESSIDTNKIEIDSEIQTKFIGSDLFDMINELNAIGKIAVGLLFLNSAIFSALVSIVFIFYGEYLISHFKLETKYPKLAHLIQLRRRFQQYYLITSILIILFSVLIEVLFCLSILNLELNH